jgi:hypothetical protein
MYYNHFHYNTYNSFFITGSWRCRRAPQKYFLTQLWIEVLNLVGVPVSV